MHRLPRALTLRQQAIAPLLRRTPIPRTPRVQRRWKSHALYGPDGQAVRHRTVRFKKPGLSLSKVAMFALYTSLAWSSLKLLIRHLDIEIEYVEDLRGADAQQQQAGQEAAKDREDEEYIEIPEYAAEDSLFVPMTWGKKMPRTYYRGSDPEWQEFIKVAKDVPRHKKIQDELVQIVFAGSSQHPRISRQLGKDAKVGKFWLDISFPDGPPPDFERKGIEIGDGYIAWSTQKIDAAKQWRAERALIPRAAADGVWQTSKTLAGMQWRRTKQWLGLAEVDPTSPEERFRAAVEQMKQRKEKQGSETQTNPTGSVVAPAASSAQAPSDAQASSETPASRPNAQAEKKGNLPWLLPSLPLPTAATSAASSTDLTIAMHVFSATLSKSWNPKQMEPPRGTFVVQGLVEVRGSQGRMMFDVQSCYDPQANKFVHVNAGVRGYKRWKQSPKGGP